MPPQVTESDVLGALRPIIDPDFNKSIVELGFIKQLRIERGSVAFAIELTTPACPVKAEFEKAARERVLALDKGELAAQARLGIGRLLETQTRLESALAEYLKVSVLYEHAPSVAAALYSAGRCLEALEDPEKAAKQYRELIERYPNSDFLARARKRLAALDSQ